MSYFAHQYASNSDIKKIVSRHEGHVEPDNLQEIFNLGTAIHAGILEPHLIDTTGLTGDQIELTKLMANTFWKDEMCRAIAMMPDFRREHEFYRVNRFGLSGVRCKVDGESKSLKTILELKGLAVTTEKAFKESVLHMNYDQGAAWYLDVASGSVVYKQKLIVGISKKKPDMLFKILIDRNHDYYKSGMMKVEKGVNIWKQYGYN